MPISASTYIKLFLCSLMLNAFCKAFTAEKAVNEDPWNLPRASVH
jgi:hypothetical protein